jgi:AAA domain, putative AbiEii toxin, Type IV TA system/AAA ATPase domain
MKYYLFVDNFRGFSDTCIPITDVNFLVGENSTGKTSILSLIKLFSGPSFLMGQDFDDEGVGFRHFSDMVSVHSVNPTYFHIGFAAEFESKKTGKVATGCLFTFREKQGQPRLSKCTFCRGKEKITLKFGNSIYFKTSECSAATESHQIISALRSEWVGEHSGKTNGYQKLDAPRGFGNKVPILIALSLVSDQSRKQRKRGEFILYPPDFGFAPPELTWFGPIRTEPKRTYDELVLDFSSEGRHTPYLIRRMLNSKTQAAKLKAFIEKVGKASGLFQDVKIQSFGRGPNPRFELDIVLDGLALNILNVGYGVSQSLPIIVEFLARERGTWFAVQEPEIHLHPRAQATLGDVLFEMAATDRKRFLVETHSDFAIDRFRLNYKNGRLNKPDSQILFFERRDKHNIVTPLVIGKDGELPADQPDNYRQFFVREQMNLLGI